MVRLAVCILIVTHQNLILKDRSETIYATCIMQELFTILCSKIAHKLLRIRLTWLMSLKSWLTSIIPPLKELIASASASIVSISRWLVGSSSNRRWGLRNASHANITRHRCPSDKFLIAQICYIVCRSGISVHSHFVATYLWFLYTTSNITQGKSCPGKQKQSGHYMNNKLNYSQRESNLSRLYWDDQVEARN